MSKKQSLIGEYKIWNLDDLETAANSTCIDYFNRIQLSLSLSFYIEILSQNKTKTPEWIANTLYDKDEYKLSNTGIEEDCHSITYCNCIWVRQISPFFQHLAVAKMKEENRSMCLYSPECFRLLHSNFSVATQKSNKFLASVSRDFRICPIFLSLVICIF